MKIHSKHSKARLSGFTLIEVLITLVIFAVGLLGLATMQLQGMQYIHSAYVRTQAQVMSYDILDRLRANRIEAMNTNNYTWLLNADPLPLVTNCTTAVCTESQMALYDIFEWRQLVAEHLPQGRGDISFETLATGGRLYTIEIRWLDDRTIEVEDNADFNDRFQTFEFKAEL
jgi:type IV pilus assembly protein PilV